MATRLIIDGNAVYEIDEDCLESKRGNRRRGSFGGLKSDKNAKERKSGMDGR